MHCDSEDCAPVAVQLLSKGTSMGVEEPVQSVLSVKTSAMAAVEFRQVTVRELEP